MFLCRQLSKGTCYILWVMFPDGALTHNLNCFLDAHFIRYVIRSRETG
ncbi:MAG: hypothetical protein ACEY29_03565 [Arsenophonus sp.]